MWEASVEKLLNFIVRSMKDVYFIHDNGQILCFSDMKGLILNLHGGLYLPELFLC